MKKTGFTLVSLFLLFSFITQAYADTAVIDRILAVVNGDIITLSEFERYKTLLYMGSPEKPSGREAEQQVLGTIIEKKLLLQDAKKLEIDAKDKEVEAAFEDIMKRNNITRKALKEELAKQGATVEEYRELLKGEIIQSHVIGRQVHSKISITDKDIQEYNEKNMKGREKSGPRVRIQQILLLLPPNAAKKQISEIERNAADIREKVVAGEDFEKLAALYSQGAGAQTGGDIGYFHRGELMPEIEQVAFALDKGQVSEIIKTSLGLHLIKIIDRDAPEGGGSPQGQDKEIKALLYNMEFEKRITEYLNGLKEKAYIEINY